MKYKQILRYLSWRKQTSRWIRNAELASKSCPEIVHGAPPVANTLASAFYATSPFGDCCIGVLFAPMVSKDWRLESIPCYSKKCSMYPTVCAMSFTWRKGLKVRPSWPGRRIRLRHEGFILSLSSTKSSPDVCICSAGDVMYCSHMFIPEFIRIIYLFILLRRSSKLFGEVVFEKHWLSIWLRAWMQKCAPKSFLNTRIYIYLKLINAIDINALKSCTIQNALLELLVCFN